MIFWPLLKTELLLLKNKLVEKIIDSLIWACSTISVSAFVLPAFGMSKNFGVFQAAGLVVAIISFELYGNIFEIVSDIEHTGYIKYLLTLPQTNYSIISTRAVFYAIQGFIAAMIILPVVCLVLFSQINFAAISFVRLFFATALSCIFFAWFAIFLAQQIHGVAQIRSTQVRFLFPLWYFGGFSFSFKVAFFKVSKWLGLLCLVSPYTFATEATRSAILGPVEFIPFWLSCAVLSAITVGVAGFGYRGLKRRLDFV